MRITVKINQAITIVSQVNANYEDVYRNGAVPPVNILLGAGQKGAKMVAIEANLSLLDNATYESGLEVFSITVSPADSSGNTVKGTQPQASGFGKVEAETATFYFNQQSWVDPLYVPQGFEVTALQIRTPRYLGTAPVNPTVNGTLTFVFE